MGCVEGQGERTFLRAIQMRAAAARLQEPQFPLLAVVERMIALPLQSVHQIDLLQPGGSLHMLHLRGVERVLFCVGAWEDPRRLRERGVSRRRNKGEWTGFAFHDGSTLFDARLQEKAILSG